MSINRTCAIANFTCGAGSEGMSGSLPRSGESDERRSASEHPPEWNLRSEVHGREAGSMQILVQRGYVLRNDFLPTFRQCSRLTWHFIHGRFDAIGRCGVDPLNLAKQLLCRIQSMERRSCSRPRVWRSQLL